MEIVRLKRAEHDGGRRIALEFGYVPHLTDLVRKLPGARWSRTLKAWHVANTPENLRLIFSTFKGIAGVDPRRIPTKFRKDKGGVTGKESFPERHLNCPVLTGNSSNIFFNKILVPVGFFSIKIINLALLSC